LGTGGRAAPRGRRLPKQAGGRRDEAPRKIGSEHRGSPGGELFLKRHLRYRWFG